MGEREDRGRGCNGGGLREGRTFERIEGMGEREDRGRGCNGGGLRVNRTFERVERERGKDGVGHTESRANI